jgi:hypothetical protein
LTKKQLNIEIIDFEEKNKIDIVSFYLSEHLNKDHITSVTRIRPKKKEEEKLLYDSNYLIYYVFDNNDLIKKNLKKSGFSILNEDDREIICGISKKNPFLQKIVNMYQNKKLYGLKIGNTGTRKTYIFSELNKKNCLLMSYEHLLIQKYFFLRNKGNEESINKFYSSLINFNKFLEDVNSLILKEKNEYDWNVLVEDRNKDVSYELKRIHERLKLVNLCNEYYQNPTEDNINRITLKNLNEIILYFLFIMTKKSIDFFK